jgi:hypothetical protein
LFELLDGFSSSKQTNVKAGFPVICPKNWYQNCILNFLTIVALKGTSLCEAVLFDPLRIRTDYWQLKVNFKNEITRKPEKTVS